MGAGQSKKQKEYPFPTPSFPYAGQYPPGYMPQYGLAYPSGPPAVFPQQGFIPPGAYGPGGFIPPPQPPQPPPQQRGPRRERHSKQRRSSRRTQSENFVGGFAVQAQAQAQAQAEAGPRRASESHHRKDGPSMPVPEVPQIVPEATTNRRPSASHRAPTPFVPALRRYEEDDEEEDRDRDVHRGNSRQSNVRFPEPAPIDGNIRNVLQPVDRGNSNDPAYGPSSQRPRTPLKNPLPPPPRDIYDMSPYRAIVNLPHTTALLSGPYGPQSLSFTNAAAEMDQSSTKVKRNNTVKGILRAFSKKEKPKQTPERVYVPVFVDTQSGAQSSMPQPQVQSAQGTLYQINIPQSQATQIQMPQIQVPQTQMPQAQTPPPQMPQAQMPPPQMPQAQMPPPQMPQGQMPPPQMPTQPEIHRPASRQSQNPSGPSMPQPDMPSTPHNPPRFPSVPSGSDRSSSPHSSSGSHTPRRRMSPVPPSPSVPPPVRFGQRDRLNGFLNHSIYRVLYRGKMYPTGLHLHEAMKFIDHRPDIAEKIRTAPEPQDVYPLSSQFSQFQRADWRTVYVDCMEQIIGLKVEQHADLRVLLIGTGWARIEYTDPLDDFWGTGATGDGKNMLGKVMMRVRDRIYDTM